MREYTKKQIKELEKNPYTHKVTKHKTYFTAEFKKEFWNRYQVGTAPKKILEDLGYDRHLFKQKTLDSLVQRIKKQALSGKGFTEGEDRSKRVGVKALENISSPESLERMQHEILYLRQEVEFLKKIIKATNESKGKL